MHLTDGSGSAKDERMVPGRGDQNAARALEYVAQTDFAGHVVLEVNTRKAETRAQREQDIAADRSPSPVCTWRPRCTPPTPSTAEGVANVLTSGAAGFCGVTARILRIVHVTRRPR